MSRRFLLACLVGSALSASLLVAACSSDGPTGFADGQDGSADGSGRDTGTTTEPPIDLTPVVSNDSGAGPRDATVADADPSCVRTPPSLRCGFFPQCGCLPTETCDLVDLDGGVECVPAGTFPLGARCTSTVGCQRGLICMSGTCHEPCGSAGGPCGGDDAGSCAQITTSGDAAVPNALVCQQACDLRDSAACGPKNAAGIAGCAYLGDGRTDCLRAGSVDESGSCDAKNLCKPGMTCVTVGNDGPKCKAWCRVGQTDCGGKTCIAFASNKPMVGGVEYGVCN